MLKLAVIGTGHLGRIHIEQWKQIQEVDIIGIYDLDQEKSRSVAEELGVHLFENIDELIDLADAIDVVTTTQAHFAVAEKIIKKGKHLFIEKPLSSTLEQARMLVEMVNEANIKCQIGHVERFNPAFLALKGRKIEPLFIECHRLAQFNARGTDVSVILDLMIHDIDIVLHLVKSDLKKVSASGVNIISDSSDIANVRLEFANGCVVNMTASRISLKKMRKVRIFQKDAYISMDFLTKKSEIVQIKDHKTDIGLLDFPIMLADGREKVISVEIPESEPVNSIKMELEYFRDCIVNDIKPAVTVEDGYQAMQIAHEILDKIK